ncbi:hypothetical protein C8A00DRAFT_13240 [Chaetomidium leptoderma]|uniref:LrgB-like protein n=1 Tax=Chaetomidium leptoderma TaxID=669021 RepID=A0AAN7A0I2_9PEZI|nr:hypothetical protein C8A00DRAFT_13240 [Chaetomidium leptoderma]
MAGVFVFFSLFGFVIPGLEDFYRKRLKRATELLNRHMSIGFTIPVVMLCHGEVSDARSIGMIIICFVLTGMFNTIFAYFLAFPIQCLMIRYDKHFWVDRHTDTEKGGENKPPARLRKPDNHDPQPSLRAWALRHPILLLSWLLTLTLGLPLRYCSQYDVPLATFLLSSIWLTTLAIQTTIKTTPHPLHPWVRTLLAGLSNAVLWTSLAMTAYVFTDAAISHRPLPTMLATLQTHTPLSTLLLLHHTTTTTDSAAPAPTMAAGDLAITLLNSGLVAWGFKLYEYRTQLVSRAGLTVCSVSAALALGNVACGPLLASSAALGVAPRSAALAFAARSVTIALANPVMVVLGGDAGLNAAMVVGSGIVYQMGMGFGVGRWLEGRVFDTGTRAQTQTQPREGHGHSAEMAAVTAQQRANDPRVVAAGVTVGVNAAAMGTAYLYEAQSDAAPHAALSMIALGTMTVVFSSIPPLARWVVESVSG